MLAGVKRALPIVLVAALGGCSLGSDEKTEPVGGDAKRVATTIQRLDAATRASRFDLICRRLFTRAARKRAGGANCAKLLSATAKGVRRPRISLVSITLEEKGRAEARVRTVAVGQEPIEETIHLERERGAFRIEALG
jgi:hypothetical protein